MTSSEVDALVSRAMTARRENRLEEARRDFFEAVGLCRRAGERDALVRALAGLGQIERDLNRLEKALANYSEAADLCRTLSDTQRLAHVVRHIADIHLDSGRIDEAEPHYNEALQIYRAGDQTRPLDLANALRGLAILKEKAGDPEQARSLWKEAGDIYAAQNIEPGVTESARRIAALT